MKKDLHVLVNGRTGHFRFESGHHGDRWMDLETLCLRSREVRELATQLAERLGKYEVDVVCGPLVEGAFVALLVSFELGCEFTYAERVAHEERKLPESLHRAVRGKRVAIVNDVISAGSAVRGAFADLRGLGANVVVTGALLGLGESFARFADAQNVALELLEQQSHNLWTPETCPLCAAGKPLEVVGIA